MAIHSSMLAWRIPWTEEPSGLKSMGSQESDTLVTKFLLQRMISAQSCCMFSSAVHSKKYWHVPSKEYSLQKYIHVHSHVQKFLMEMTSWTWLKQCLKNI